MPFFRLIIIFHNPLIRIRVMIRIIAMIMKMIIRRVWKLTCQRESHVR